MLNDAVVHAKQRRLYRRRRFWGGLGGREPPPGIGHAHHVLKTLVYMYVHVHEAVDILQPLWMTEVKIY